MRKLVRISRMRVTIVGGGIAGLCAAWELSRAGAEVTVVEKSTVGSGTSRGNAGWVVPALTAPLSAPGSVRQGLRLMAERDNPFFIRPRPSPRLAQWLYQFWRSSSPARFAENVRAIYALGQRTLEQFDELAAAGVQFEMSGGGLIFLCLSEPSLMGTLKRIEQLVSLGYAGEVEFLDRAALVAREPAVNEEVVGGLHLKDVRRVRPETLTRGLSAALQAKSVQLLENTPVASLERSKSNWRVRTQQGDVPADRVVLASGIWANELLAPLDVNLLMEAGKGYSLTAEGDGLAPGHAVHMVEPMVGVSPFEGGVRLAGMV